MKDCFAYYDKINSKVYLGNGCIEKIIGINNCFICTESVTDKINGKSWRGKRALWQRCPVFSINEAPTVKFEVTEHGGAFGMKPHIKATLELIGVEGEAFYEYIIFSEIPFIYSQIYVNKSGTVAIGEASFEKYACTGVEMQDRNADGGDVFCSADTLDCIPLGLSHFEVESHKLYDKTDINDSLAEYQKTSIYKRGKCERDGNVFCINDYPNGDSLMIVKHSPTQSSALNRKSCDLVIQGIEYAALLGTGVDFNDMPSGKIPYYASAVGVSKTKDIYDAFWHYSTAFSTGDPRQNLFIMSNTWGDRSQDSAVCEEFMLKELECAKKLGVDIVQIDDGWQAGITANSLRKKGGVWEGYYSNNANFWQASPKNFPNGLEPIINKAKEYGIEIGLWFSPDSSNDFINVEKDIETLMSLYEKYGIRYFKLDGVKIRNKLCEMRFIHLLSELTRRTNGNIRFNLDVTAEDRFGYLYQTQFGTLFVENRYTDFVNYFPHNTFKNLWKLSSIIPAKRLQMELLNKRRNAEKYENIPFAPALYGMDYIFATVIPANPLVWMEMTNLNCEDAKLLSKITEVYKLYASELFASRVIPIGEEPNGMSFSGYFCRNDIDKNVHMLLFRESAAEDTYKFKLPQCIDESAFEVIYQSTDANISLKKDAVTVKLKDERSFVWLKTKL